MNEIPKSESAEVDIQIPKYEQCEFGVTLRKGGGKKRNVVEICFEDDPPFYVLSMLSDNLFRYNVDRDVWFTKLDSQSLLVAEKIVEIGLLPKDNLSFRKSRKPDKKKNYRAKKIVDISEKIIPPALADQSLQGRAAISAIEIIDLVHQIDDNFPCVPVKLVEECDGYAAEYLDYPLEILINSTEPPRVMTLAHEVGHYLDDYLGEKIDDWRQNILSKIKETSGYKQLKNFDVNGTTTIYITRNGITTKRNYPSRKVDPGQEFRIEACGNDELFARGYEQYIATKSGGFYWEIESGTKFSLEYYEGEEYRGYPLMWKEDDFQDVAKLYDQMFVDIGWK